MPPFIHHTSKPGGAGWTSPRRRRRPLAPMFRVSEWTPNRPANWPSDGHDRDRKSSTDLGALTWRLEASTKSFARARPPFNYIQGLRFAFFAARSLRHQRNVRKYESTKVAQHAAAIRRQGKARCTRRGHALRAVLTAWYFTCMAVCLYLRLCMCNIDIDSINRPSPTVGRPQHADASWFHHQARIVGVVAVRMTRVPMAGVEFYMENRRLLK